MRRLLVVILIIAAVIFLGWNTPFKDWTAQTVHKYNILVRQPCAVKARGARRFTRFNNPTS